MNCYNYTKAVEFENNRFNTSFLQKTKALFLSETSESGILKDVHDEYKGKKVLKRKRTDVQKNKSAITYSFNINELCQLLKQTNRDECILFKRDTIDYDTYICKPSIIKLYYPYFDQSIEKAELDLFGGKKHVTKKLEKELKNNPLFCCFFTEYGLDMISFEDAKRLYLELYLKTKIIEIAKNYILKVEYKRVENIVFKPLEKNMEQQHFKKQKLSTILGLSTDMPVNKNKKKINNQKHTKKYSIPSIDLLSDNKENIWSGESVEYKIPMSEFYNLRIMYLKVQKKLDTIFTDVMKQVVDVYHELYRQYTLENIQYFFMTQHPDEPEYLIVFSDYKQIFDVLRIHSGVLNYMLHNKYVYCTGVKEIHLEDGTIRYIPNGKKVEFPNGIEVEENKKFVTIQLDKYVDSKKQLHDLFMKMEMHKMDDSLEESMSDEECEYYCVYKNLDFTKPKDSRNLLFIDNVKDVACKIKKGELYSSYGTVLNYYRNFVKEWIDYANIDDDKTKTFFKELDSIVLRDSSILHYCEYSLNNILWINDDLLDIQSNEYTLLLYYWDMCKSSSLYKPKRTWQEFYKQNNFIESDTIVFYHYNEIPTEWIKKLLYMISENTDKKYKIICIGTLLNYYNTSIQNCDIAPFVIFDNEEYELDQEKFGKFQLPIYQKQESIFSLTMPRSKTTSMKDFMKKIKNKYKSKLRKIRKKEKSQTWISMFGYPFTIDFFQRFSNYPLTQQQKTNICISKSQCRSLLEIQTGSNSIVYNTNSVFLDNIRDFPIHIKDKNKYIMKTLLQKYNRNHAYGYGNIQQYKEDIYFGMYFDINVVSLNNTLLNIENDNRETAILHDIWLGSESMYTMDNFHSDSLLLEPGMKVYVKSINKVLIVEELEYTTTDKKWHKEQLPYFLLPEEHNTNMQLTSMELLSSKYTNYIQSSNTKEDFWIEDDKDYVKSILEKTLESMAPIPISQWKKLSVEDKQTKIAYDESHMFKTRKHNVFQDKEYYDYNICHLFLNELYKNDYKKHQKDDKIGYFMKCIDEKGNKYCIKIQGINSEIIPFEVIPIKQFISMAKTNVMKKSKDIVILCKKNHKISKSDMSFMISLYGQVYGKTMIYYY